MEAHRSPRPAEKYYEEEPKSSREYNMFANESLN